METTIKSQQVSALINSGAVRSSTVKQPSALWKAMEFNRFGIISMVVLIIGCLGGFAASFGAQGSVMELAMVAFPTIIALAMVLAVAPMKVIVYVSSLALLLDLAVLIF